MKVKQMPEYTAYCSAKHRCKDLTNHYYGGRGIEFRFESFKEFFAEIGPKPKGMVLDRINNDGHYECGNVRWTTPSESSRNQRHTKFANPATIEGCRKGGQITGPIIGRKNAESGHLRNISSIGGLRLNALHGNPGTTEGRQLAMHNRWHLARSIINLNCKFCSRVSL